MEALKINWFLEAIRHTCMWKSSQGTEFNKLIHHAHADKGEKLILALKRDLYLGFINGKKESYCNSKCPAREWSKTNKRQSLLALELIRWGPFWRLYKQAFGFWKKGSCQEEKNSADAIRQRRKWRAAAVKYFHGWFYFFCSSQFKYV